MVVKYHCTSDVAVCLSSNLQEQQCWCRGCSRLEVCAGNWPSRILLGTTVELHLPGLIGAASLPDNLIFLTIGYIKCLKWEKKILQTAVLGYIYIYIYIYLRTNKTLFGWWPSNVTAEENSGNSLSNMGNPSPVTIYSTYLRLILSTTPDLQF